MPSLRAARRPGRTCRSRRTAPPEPKSVTLEVGRQVLVDVERVELRRRCPFVSSVSSARPVGVFWKRSEPSTLMSSTKICASGCGRVDVRVAVGLVDRRAEDAVVVLAVDGDRIDRRRPQRRAASSSCAIGIDDVERVRRRIELRRVGRGREAHEQLPVRQRRRRAIHAALRVRRRCDRPDGAPFSVTSLPVPSTNESEWRKNCCSGDDARRSGRRPSDRSGSRPCRCCRSRCRAID